MKLTIGSEEVKQVSSFVYLSSVYAEDGNCTNQDIKKLTLGRTMMQSLATIWRRKDVTKPTKICLLKVVAWPVAYMDARAGLITQKRRTAH